METWRRSPRADGPPCRRVAADELARLRTSVLSMDEPTRAFAEINGLRLYYEIHTEAGDRSCCCTAGC